MSHFVARLPRPYDVRVLLQAYTYTRRTDHVHHDIAAYYNGLLAALEPLFGVRLSREGLSFRQGVLWGLFENTVGSMLRISTPWDPYLEEGLVVVTLRESEDAGRLVFEASDEIVRAARASEAAHRDMLLHLFTAIFGPCERVVTSEELSTAGFDDSREPNFSDYWQYL